MTQNAKTVFDRVVSFEEKATVLKRILFWSFNSQLSCSLLVYINFNIFFFAGVLLYFRNISPQFIICAQDHWDPTNFATLLSDKTAKQTLKKKQKTNVRVKVLFFGYSMLDGFGSMPLVLLGKNWRHVPKCMRAIGIFKILVNNCGQ